MNHGNGKSIIEPAGNSSPVSKNKITSHSSLDTARSADFWALRDVSFKVRLGEVAGNIGRHGWHYGHGLAGHD
jgi:ABC-type polysaccharide/polyol phosphate transport system ATPase subunit